MTLIPILMLMGAAVFMVVAIKNIKWAIFLIALLLPAYLVRFALGPFPSTLLEILLIITILVWGFKYRGFRSKDARTQPWALPLILLLTAGGAGIVMAPDPVAALGLFRAYILEPVLFFFVTLSTIRTKEDVKWILTALGISAFILSIYAIAQRLTGFGIPSPFDVDLRATSFYPFPNAVGLFLVSLIPIFIMQTIKTVRESWMAVFWAVTAVASILAIVFSKTEGAWVGILVGLFVIGLLAWNMKVKIATVVFGVLVVLVVAGVPAIREPVMEKLTLRDWSGQVRRIQWTETARMLQDHSFFGAGLAGYPVTIRDYHRATFIEIFQYPHNIFFNFWSELGILGMLAFGWICLLTFFMLQISRHEYPFLALGITAGLIAMLVHGFVDVPYFKNDLSVQFWIFAALASFMALPNVQPPKSENKNAYLDPRLPLPVKDATLPPSPQQ